MTSSTGRQPVWMVSAAVAALIAVSFIPRGDQTLGGSFLAAMRIAKPKAVTPAGGPGVAGGGRQLQNVIAGILAETTAVVRDESDVPAPNADSASRMAGFRAHVVGARRDSSPAFFVLGAHDVSVSINRDQFQTLLTEAGRPASVPAALNGAPVTLARPRGVRVQTGHCPVPIANTLQNQIQGPPPPSVDNGTCVILTETPLAIVSTPAGLDTAAAMAIALELSGMSPNQTRDFRALFDWRSALSLSAPRGMRSYEMTKVGANPAMLMLTAGRREPAWSLVWVRDGLVYSLSGYASSAEAVALAASID